MNNEAKSLPPDYAGVYAALRRAADRALALARETGTHCHVWREGKIVDLAAEEEAGGQVAETVSEGWAGTSKDSPGG